MARGINTKCLHLEEEEGCCNNYGAISFPIYQTATYEHPAVGQSTGFDYSRLQNPTREHLEKIVATLENGIDALAFSTGMAAITLVMELFKPGDHLIIDADLYGGSIRLFDNVSLKNGIHFSRIDCWKENVESYVNENTKAIYIETPTNPMMNVTDIAALAEIAKRHNLLLIVDNTFLSPYFQNPLELGADIVVHSGTKFLGGHNDTLAGFLVTNREDISEKLRFLIKTTGSGLAQCAVCLLQLAFHVTSLRDIPILAKHHIIIRMHETLEIECLILQLQLEVFADTPMFPDHRLEHRHYLIPCPLWQKFEDILP